MSTQNHHNQNPRIIGAFEVVDFPEFGQHNITAKIDTGAYTGALHCSSIEEIHSNKGSILAFVPLGSDMLIKKDEFAVNHVKSSNGEREQRFFIKTKVNVQGKLYTITLSLANRSEMKWPVLIGRRFLKKHHFIVDPSRVAGYGEHERTQVNDL